MASTLVSLLVFFNNIYLQSLSKTLLTRFMRLVSLFFSKCIQYLTMNGAGDGATQMSLPLLDSDSLLSKLVSKSGSIIRLGHGEVVSAATKSTRSLFMASKDWLLDYMRPSL